MGEIIEYMLRKAEEKNEAIRIREEEARKKAEEEARQKAEEEARNKEAARKKEESKRRKEQKREEQRQKEEEERMEAERVLREAAMERLDKGDYKGYFSLFERDEWFEELIYAWDKIPDEEKHNIFLYVLPNGGSYCSRSTKHIYEDVIRLRPKLPDAVMQQLCNGRVYFGGGGCSPQHASCWVLSIETAFWISKIFDIEQPGVRSGRVDPNDVLAYLEENGQKYIIVRPWSVVDIHEEELGDIGM